MGQVLGKVTVENEKAKELEAPKPEAPKPKEPKPEAPNFPDYMLDSNAVVSPWF